MSFAPPAGPNDPGSTVRHIVMQNDGKIYVSRENALANNPPTRLNPEDGSRDPTFLPPADLLAVYAVQPDGKLIALRPGSLLRLFPDGSVDPTFNGASGGSLIDLQPDGRLIVGENDGFVAMIRRLNADGSIDNSFQPIRVDNRDGPQAQIVVLDRPRLDLKGRLVLTGIYKTINSVLRSPLVRFNPNGTRDTTFRGPNVYSGHFVEPLANNQVLVSGRSLDGSGYFLRLDDDGSADRSFQPATPAPYTITQTRDEKIVFYAVDRSINTIGRLFRHGALDSSFHTVSLTNETQDAGTTIVYDLTMQKDGKILVGGAFSRVNGVARKNLARLHGDLTLFDPIRSNTTFQVSIPTLSGIDYVLESKNSLSDTNWIELANTVGSGAWRTLNDGSATNHQRFYRVRSR